MACYRIREWTKTFENNRTKELKTMFWVPMPTKHDSDGFTELMDHPDGVTHYGVWCLIVQVAARCDPRGTLMRDSGTSHNSSTLARLTRAAKEAFDAAIPRLVSVGWLETYGEGATISQEGATFPHDPAQQNSTTENRTEEENREQDQTEQAFANPEPEASSSTEAEEEEGGEIDKSAVSVRAEVHDVAGKTEFDRMVRSSKDQAQQHRNRTTPQSLGTEMTKIANGKPKPKRRKFKRVSDNKRERSKIVLGRIAGLSPDDLLDLSAIAPTANIELACALLSDAKSTGKPIENVGGWLRNAILEEWS